MAARSLQVFLDRVGFLAADLSGFLLNEEFDGLLNDSERDVAAALRTLTQAAGTDDELGAKIAQLLSRFGG